MSYVVLARKYRPVNFDEVVGQEHLTELLKQAIKADRVAHAYLFCGPRGIGKTSCARILAKSLNCAKAKNSNPCDECNSCKEITQGTSFDVLEIDGASNRGIDEIRTLRENVKFAPSYGEFKIYIVDEVHMLTMEAFNALLKTLEEPPPHVKFIFATTDPNKVPSTIISRCQRYDFKRIPLKMTVKSLAKLCKKEKLKVSEDALYAIAKAAQGSFRDALSILDQMSALKDQNVEGKDVYSMLGLVEMDLLFELVEALSAGNCAEMLKTFDAIIDKGKDIKQLSRDLVEHFRNLMIVKIGGKSLGRLVEYPVAIKELYLEQSKKFSLGDILKSIDALIEAQDTARITESLRTPLEIAFAKLTYSENGAPAARVKPQDTELEKKESSSDKTAPRPLAARILKNQKGEFSPAFSSDDSNAQEDEDTVETQEIENAFPADNNLSLAVIKKSWDALTSAVSREKMSIATYLQEGIPFSLEGNILTVGFAPEHEFHKETLESQEYVKIVEKVFSDKLRAQTVVRYKSIDNFKAEQRNDEEPLVKSALDTFQGKVVSKWHNE